MEAFRPQRDYLKLISAGQKAAVADKFGLRLEGPLLWRWKDRIDRAFMDRLANLPAMTPPPLPADLADGVREALAGGKPMCGGCGSKLGRGTLGAVLAAQPATARRADVESAPMDDAAILSFGGTRQVISTDHLRAFLDDPHIMARIAANHALGDVFAMGAGAQAMLATVILPRASAAIHTRMLAEIMEGASAVARDAGAEIVGGHTLVGDSLGIGFTVTGLCDRALTLSGAMAGDTLILTKPLGSGVIMAADMALAAKGTWVAGAVGLMQQSQRTAAQILTAAGARAMTDVTGFGLAGHLGAIAGAAGLSAHLVLDDIPLMEGAAVLAAQGHRSTLYPDNLTGAGPVTLPADPRADLLFDPQTAGGLLAALPADRAADALLALTGAGYTAAHIGHLAAGPPGLTVV